MKTVLKTIALLGIAFVVMGCPSPTDGGGTLENKGPFTVSFDSMGANVIPSEQVAKGNIIVDFPYPKNTDTDSLDDELVFSGWYTVKNGSGAENRFEQSMPITTDLTLYASWKRPTEGVKYIESGDTVSVGISDVEGEVVIAREYNGKPVTVIGERAFSSRKLTSVIIPDSVITIEREAFNNCTGLTSVTIGESVETIGVFAFAYCEALTSVTIPNSVTEITSFFYCDALTSIQCSKDNNTYMTENGVLYSKDKEALVAYPAGKTDKTFIIPDSVTSLGWFSFAGSSLTSIIIPNNVKTIGSYAFNYSKALTKVIIPDTVTTIKQNTFQSCSALTSVTIGNSVETIESYAFDRCSSLVNIVLPNSVETIGKYAFAYCEDLTSITLPENVTEIESSSFSLDELTAYVGRSEAPAGGKFNLSTLSTVWGGVLSDGVDEASYVVSVKKTNGSIETISEGIILNAPYREGYIFLGWASSSDGVAIEGGANALKTVDNDIWYAVWSAS